MSEILKLTRIQKNVLQLLLQGEIMVVDKTNMAYIQEISIASKTRYFLTKNNLVERKDKTKSISTKGNGYIISKKGVELLVKNL